MNLLVNPGFEGGLQPRELPDGSKPQHLAYVSEVQVTGGAITQRYTVERGEIRNPLGWFAWYAHQRSESPVPWDPPNQVGWAEPETRLSETEHQRHRSGERAFYLFTYGRIHEAGLFQQVRVTPGDLLRFTAFGHAWSAHDQPTPKPPHCSNAGCGPLAWKAGTPGLNDDQKAHTLWVGIDPTGGIDPYASSVIWGDGWHIYNNYRNEPLAVEAVAQNEVVTVFLRSSCLWRFTHNDVAWDDATLVVPGAPGPVIPPPPVGGEQPYIARGTKVGYHCIAPRQVPGHVAQLAQQGAPVPVVKAVDDWGALVEIKRVSPQTITVARKTFGYDIELAAGLAGMTPAQIKAHAQYLMGLLREKCLEEVQRGGMERLAAIDYLSTPICEADPKTADGSGYRNLALLMLEMLDIAERWDLPCKRLALFELNAGTPEWWDYVAMLETGVFERMQAGGHVLALHEGTLAVDGYTWEDAPIDLWWGPGHTIPGAPDVLGSGSLCFRYRYLLHLLRQRGLYVPIVISEFYSGGGYAGADPADILARMRWYDTLAAQDPEVLGFTPFTFGGAGVGWDAQDYDFMLPVLYDYTLTVKDRANAAPGGATPPPSPPGAGRGAPREQYARRVHVLPPTTPLERAREVFALAWAAGRETVGGSYDDAGVGDLDARTAVLWDVPLADREVFRAWYAEHYPGVVVEFAGAAEDEPLWLTYPSTRLPAEITSPYGPRGTGFHYGVDLRASWAVWRTEVLAALDGEVVLTGIEPGKAYFGEQVQIRARHGGREVLLRYAHLVPPSQGGIYVQVGERVVRGQKLGRPDNTGQSTADHLHFDVRINGQYVDPTPLIRWPDAPQPPQPPPPPPPPPPSGPVLFGLHDEAGDGGETGAQWMAAQGLRGLIVRPVYLGTHPQMLDFGAAEAAGLRVIVNLRYSWAVDNGGQGTLPRPGSPGWTLFVQAAAQTLITSRGVWGWEIGNEANNPREWPHGGVLLPAQLAEAYNAIREAVWRSTARPRMAPGALDPFNAQAGDPRDWLREVWNRVSGAEFVAAHGYVRGPDPNLVGSAARFADAPLQWQYLNYPGCVTELLASLPSRWAALPVYVTEFNHLWKTVEPDWGWVDDERAADIVRRAHQAARAAGFAGVAIYRWNGDEWRVQHNHAVRGTLIGLLG